MWYAMLRANAVLPMDGRPARIQQIGGLQPSGELVQVRVPVRSPVISSPRSYASWMCSVRFASSLSATNPRCSASRDSWNSSFCAASDDCAVLDPSKASPATRCEMAMSRRSSDRSCTMRAW